MSNKERIKGYCSNCYELTTHKLVEEYTTRHNEYKCTNCSATTVLCKNCGEDWDSYDTKNNIPRFAIAGEKPKFAVKYYCDECSGIIKDF